MIDEQPVSPPGESEHKGLLCKLEDGLDEEGTGDMGKEDKEEEEDEEEEDRRGRMR